MRGEMNDMLGTVVTFGKVFATYEALSMSLCDTRKYSRFFLPSLNVRSLIPFCCARCSNLRFF